MSLHSTIAAVTERIVHRSRDSRAQYLKRIRAAAENGPRRSTLSCGNLAHGFAACGVTDKARLAGDVVPNLGIITAYNDMLSAHQPYERFPELIRERPARSARSPRSPPAFRPCATASPRARPAWNCRCSPAT